MTAPEMIDAAGRGELDVLFAAGGNFLEVLPDPEHVRAALGADPAARPHGHRRSRARCWSSPRDDGPAAAGDDPLRDPRRRHRDDRPSGGSSSAPRSRARGSARRARSGRCCGELAARVAPGAGRRGSASPGRDGDPRGDRPGGPALRGIERAARAGRLSSSTAGRTSARAGDFPTAGRQGALRRRSPLPEPVADDGLLRALAPGAASSSTAWSRSAATRSPAPCARRS